MTDETSNDHRKEHAHGHEHDPLEEGAALRVRALEELMDGIHDIGGMHGFGRVPLEQDSVFTSDWQKRAFALVEALAWSTPYSADEHRQAIERIAPADYLGRDYFEKWVIATGTLLREAGLVDQGELDSGKKRFDISPEGHQPIGPDDLVAATKAGADLEFDAASEPAKYD